MSPSDPPPPPARRQPSLIDTPGAESAAARQAPSLRMLEGLDETTSRKASKAPNSGFPSTQATSGFDAPRASDAAAARNGRTGWMIATALALAVLAVLWWWTQDREAGASVSDDRAARNADARPAATLAVVPPVANVGEAAPADAASSPASGSTATAVAEPARIETVRDADLALPTPPATARLQSGTVTTAGVASSAAAWRAATAPATTLPGARPDEAAPNGRLAGAPSNVATATTGIPIAAVPARDHGPVPVPLASPSRPPSRSLSPPPPPAAPTTTTAARLPTELPTDVAAAPAPRKTEGANSASTDADVTLIDALLSRIGAGNSTRAAPNAPPRPAPGDLIERCESRAGKETAEAATCRPRICADQWGKSDACPAALAPKN